MAEVVVAAAESQPQQSGRKGTPALTQLGSTVPALISSGLAGSSEAGPDLESAIRILRACEWLSAEDAADPRLRWNDLSSAHSVLQIVMPGGRSAIIKRVRASGRRSLARELYVYRLAHWMPAMQSVLPQSLLIDERNQVLVLEALPCNTPNSASPAVTDPEIARYLGAAMAGWHGATHGLPSPASPMIGILFLAAALDTAEQDRPPATRTLMRRIAADAQMRGALDAARAGYRPRCLIHGDIRRENWMLDRRSGDPVLRVLDWELAGCGDPAWDIASGVAEAIVECQRSGSAGEIGDHGWPARAGAAIAIFVHAYGSRRPDYGDPIDWRHVLLCTCARLLHVACEWADWQDSADSPTLVGLVDAARALLERQAVSIGALRVWAER